jgi:hypothetical protein
LVTKSKNPETGYFVQRVFALYDDHSGPVTDVTYEFTGPNKTLYIEPGWQRIAHSRLQELDPMQPADNAVKLEVRYYFKNSLGYKTKYRMVIRDTEDDVPWPPKKKMGNPSIGKIKPPILNARLLPRYDMAKLLDVTRRVQKYLGHNNDFNDVSLRPIDFFPYDDPDEIIREYCFLEIKDLWDTNAYCLREYIQ